MRQRNKRWTAMYVLCILLAFAFQGCKEDNCGRLGCDDDPSYDSPSDPDSPSSTVGITCSPKPNLSSCTMEFCANDSLTTCYYTIDSTRINCNCNDIASCAQEAADECIDGEGNSTTTCLYQNDGTCDEPNLCAVGTDSDDCNSNQTSTSPRIKIWTTQSTGGDISVYVDGSYRGKLTQYWPSGSPTDCEPESATIVVDVSAGSHTVRAESPDYTWSSKTISVSGCYTYKLY